MTRVEKFRETFQQEGLWTALRWLNEQAPYRFTAVFRFDRDMLRNVCLVDKQNAHVRRGPDQPITDSYCIYIHRTGERFCLEGSLTDSRVERHPKRRHYQCYYGVPLFDRDNRLIGTVCHFDTEPVKVTDSVVTTLDDLAELIAECSLTSPG
jgi:GAF domain-containing protein